MTETRVIVAICVVVLLSGLLAAVRWRDRRFEPPPPRDHLEIDEVVRRYVWYAALTISAGTVAGLTIIGAGGRLAMRLLAVTAGDDAQGRLTEASEVVGEITLGGTIGFALFNGLLGGIAMTAAYLVVRRHLPDGPLGGALFGVLALVVLGTTVDPLRRDNRDFDIVGPGWLSVVVFAALAVAFGVTLSGVTARLSTWLPLVAKDRRTLARYAGPAALAALGFSVTIVMVVVGAIVVLVTRVSGVVGATRSRPWLLGGRIVLAALAALSLPSAASSVADIATRG